MRAVVLAALSVLVLTACTPSRFASRQLAADEESATVALVHSVNELGLPDDNGKSAMYCSGVFVSPTVILTAKHCVAVLGMTREQIVAHMLGLDDEVAPPNPIGAEAHYATEADYKRGSYRTGKVLAVSEYDLGAIQIDDRALQHTYARLSPGDISTGDRVEMVGHVGGYTWSYAEGLVSAIRMTEPDPHGRPSPTIQAEIAVGHGDSGGGLFNASGELVGIFSYVDARAPGMGFCVHRDAIRAFLAKLPR